ncbi:MAG: VOC family protein [Pseudomonadota bacterium]
MTEMTAAKLGWLDLTTPDAVTVRDFYEAVCGWRAQPHDMGDYEDFGMQAETGDTVAGICHARGPNANLPPVWLPYFLVPSLEQSLASVRASGGRVVEERPHPDGDGRGLAVISDPAGAHCVLWQNDPSPAGT